MKKIFIALVLFSSIFLGTPRVHAQESCRAIINKDNYDQCCSVDTVAANNDQCVKYEKTLNTPAATTATTDQGENSCYVLTTANVYTCCSNVDPKSTDLQNACIEYYRSGPQSIGGSGAQTTLPVNGSGSASYGSGLSTADQAAIASCSAIKFKTLLDIAIWAKCIIGAIIIPGIFTLAFVVFLWGVFKFIRSSEKTDKEEGKQFIYMGLIGLFVMVSVWGIIRIATTTFGLDTAVPFLQTDPLNNSNASK